MHKTSYKKTLCKKEIYVQYSLKMIHNLVLFGATGSIGTSTLNVIRRNRESFKIVALSAYSNFKKLANIAYEFGVKNIGIGDPEQFHAQCAQKYFSNDTQFFFGDNGNIELAESPQSDAIIMAIPGIKGILPTMHAIQEKKIVMLASKEVLVAAGEIVMQAAKRNNIPVLPIDSEHNAIFQCLRDEHPFLKKIILTASGGPFRTLSNEQMRHVTIEQALNHPTWRMGKKITIDSATMSNKGFEIIEARWLFDVPSSSIEVVIHPESIVHSMVEFCDGSILAQLSPHSMEYAISNCLFYPKRADNNPDSIDFSKTLSLNFSTPDYARFPCLRIAQECLAANNHSAAIFLAANEVAVQAFLEKKIGYLDIAKTISEVLNTYHPPYVNTLGHIFGVISDAQAVARSIIGKSTK